MDCVSWIRKHGIADEVVQWRSRKICLFTSVSPHKPRGDSKLLTHEIRQILGYVAQSRSNLRRFTQGIHFCDKIQSLNCPGGTWLLRPKPYEHLPGLVVYVTHDLNLAISIPLACVVLALVNADGVNPEASSAGPLTQTRQCLKAVRGDIERVWSVYKDCISRLRIAPTVRYGVVLDLLVEAVMVQLAANGTLEIGRREEFEDLYGSWVGGVERGVLERRGHLGDPAMCSLKSRCGEDARSGAAAQR